MDQQQENLFCKVEVGQDENTQEEEQQWRRKFEKFPWNQIADLDVPFEKADHEDEENDHHEKKGCWNVLEKDHQEHQNQSLKHKNHNEKLLVDVDSAVGCQNVSEKDHEWCQNQSPRHKNHNKKLLVDVDSAVVKLWKEKLEEEKWKKGEQLTSDTKNVTTPDKWITNNVIHRFVDMLNNDNQDKDAIFVSSHCLEFKDMIKGQLSILRILKQIDEDLKTKWLILVLQWNHWHLQVVDINKCSITLHDRLVAHNVPQDDQLREWGNALDSCCCVHETKDKQEKLWREALECQ